MSTAGAQGRVVWIDVAKALAIVLVVIYHVSGWFFTFVFTGSSHPVAAVWRELSILLMPMRIPLFFLVAGILAHGAVRRSWSALAATRLSDLLWPFAVWSVLIAPLWFVRLEAGGQDGLAPVIGGLLFGGTHLWFLTALAVFLVIGKITRRFPIPTLIVAAALAYWLAGPIGAWLHTVLPAALADNVTRWCIFLFWFLLGCFARPLLMRIAATPWPFAVVGTAVVGIVALTGSGIPSSIRVPVLAAFGISALIAWSSLMSRGRRTARLAGYLARRTLAIYVGHAFLLEVLALALLALRQLIPGWDPASGVAMILFVPIVTAALVFATTWLYDRCVPGPLAWLYQPPWRARKAVPV